MPGEHDKFGPDTELFRGASELAGLSNEMQVSEQFADKIAELEAQIHQAEVYLDYIQGRKEVQGDHPTFRDMEKDARSQKSEASDKLSPYQQLEILETGASDLEVMIASGLMASDQISTAQMMLGREKAAAARLRERLESSDQ